jgi:branched-chain amino acid transport system substrate-binding protein
MDEGVQYLDAGGHPVGVFSIIQQADELGLEPQIQGAPNLPTPVFYETLGELMEQGLTMFSTIDSESDAFIDVSTQFAEDTGQLFDHFHGFGYVTGKLLAAAIEEAGSADPTDIRDAIRGIEFNSILAYPISYTEWGELEEARLTGTQFTLEAPSYAPDANYGFETALRTEPLEPMEPQG